MNTEHKLCVESFISGKFVSIYIDNMTGNGLKRCLDVFRAEKADRITVLDRFHSRVYSEDGSAYNAYTDVQRPILGTLADKAHHIDCLARDFFKDQPKPYFPFWRLGNLSAWAAATSLFLLLIILIG